MINKIYYCWVNFFIDKLPYKIKKLFTVLYKNNNQKPPKPPCSYVNKGSSSLEILKNLSILNLWSLNILIWLENSTNLNVIADSKLNK